MDHGLAVLPTVWGYIATWLHDMELDTSLMFPPKSSVFPFLIVNWLLLLEVHNVYTNTKYTYMGAQILALILTSLFDCFELNDLMVSILIIWRLSFFNQSFPFQYDIFCLFSCFPFFFEYGISASAWRMNGFVYRRIGWFQIRRRDEVDYYANRTDNKKALVTYRFLNLSSCLDLSTGGFI